MIFTVASFKGGVGKTVTAVHLAAALSDSGRTMLIDGDENRSAIKWSKRGDGFPFDTISPIQVPKFAAGQEHVVFDTGQRPRDKELETNAAECDLLIVPTRPRAIDGDVLVTMIDALRAISAQNFRVLFTCVPAFAGKRAAEMRRLLNDAGIPVFEGEIPQLEAFEKAAAVGRIVRDVHDPNAQRAWDAYVQIAKELQR
jgi:chromosome partitioning protein